MRAHDLQTGPKKAKRRTSPSAPLTFVITAASSRLEKKKKRKRKDKKPGGPGLTAGAKRRVVRVGVLTPQRPANRRRHSGRATAAGRQHPVILRGCGGAGVRGEARARTSQGDELIPSHAPRKCRGPPNTRPAGHSHVSFKSRSPDF